MIAALIPIRGRTWPDELRLVEKFRHLIRQLLMRGIDITIAHGGLSGAYAVKFWLIGRCRAELVHERRLLLGLEAALGPMNFVLLRSLGITCDSS